MAYSESDKQGAAKELSNARQAIRDLGHKATNIDRKRVADAEKRYKKVTGRNP